MKSKKGITIIERFQSGNLTAYSVDGGKSYHASVTQALADQAKKAEEARIRKAIQTYVEHLMPLIAEARSNGT